MYDLLEKCREKLNSTFSYIISIFGDGLKKRVIYHLRLSNELRPELEDSDITINKADLERDVKNYIEYCVGCMFGRFGYHAKQQMLLDYGRASSIHPFVFE